MEIEFTKHRHPAIYKITNIVNGKCYIGSAVDTSMRIAAHKSKLKFNDHANRKLQHSFNKYGIENFRFEILECISDKTKLIQREQIWINYFKSYDPNFGYNLRKEASSNLGIKTKPASEERKLKIGLANSKSLLGKQHSWITKAKMSSARKGKKATDQIKNNMKLGWIKRKQKYGDSGRSSL